MESSDCKNHLFCILKSNITILKFYFLANGHQNKFFGTLDIHDTQRKNYLLQLNKIYVFKDRVNPLLSATG